MAKRIMFTGGSGKAGKHVVQYLVEHGYEVLNLDVAPLDNPKVRTLKTDITDSGRSSWHSRPTWACTSSIRRSGRSRSMPWSTSPPCRGS